MRSTCIDHKCKGFGGGYATAMYMLGGKKRYTTKHRVLYARSIGVCPSSLAGLEVMHTCDNPRCINTEHLKLGTPMDNTQDKMRKGRYVYPATLTGEVNGNCKITDAQVSEMINGRESGISLSRLASQYGVSISQVSRITKGVQRAKNNS